MAPALLSTNDVKDSLALGGAVANAPSDTALSRLIAAESAEVLRVVDDPLGVSFEGVLTRLTLTTVDVENWWTPGKVVGDTRLKRPVNRRGTNYGRNYSEHYAYSESPVPGTDMRVRLTGLTVDTSPGGDLSFKVTLSGARLPQADESNIDVADVFKEGGIAEDKSLYFIHDWTLYELGFGAINRADTDASETTVIWEYADTDAEGMAFSTAFAGVVADTEIDLIVADAAAYVSHTAQDLLAVMRNALLELLTVRLEFDAMDSVRDGTYSAVRSDYEKERARILGMVQEFTPWEQMIA